MHHPSMSGPLSLPLGFLHPDAAGCAFEHASSHRITQLGIQGPCNNSPEKEAPEMSLAGIAGDIVDISQSQKYSSPTPVLIPYKNL